MVMESVVLFKKDSVVAERGGAGSPRTRRRGGVARQSQRNGGYLRDDSSSRILAGCLADPHDHVFGSFVVLDPEATERVVFDELPT